MRRSSSACVNPHSAKRSSTCCTNSSGTDAPEVQTDDLDALQLFRLDLGGVVDALRPLGLTMHFRHQRAHGINGLRSTLSAFPRKVI